MLRLLYAVVVAFLLICTRQAAADLVEPIGTASAVQTATVTLEQGGVLGSIAVLTQGAPNLDFNLAPGGSCTVGASYTAGATCTVNYTFKPKLAGLRKGGITLTGSSGELLANAYISGSGTGPQVAYSPGAASAIATNVGESIGIAVDGSENIFFTTGADVNEVLVAGGYRNSVTLVPANGSYTDVWFLAVDGCGNLFLSEPSQGLVKEILAVGGYTTIRTVGGAFAAPYGLAIDGSGNIFVSDAGDSSIKEILAAGGYTTVKVLPGSFANPLGIAVDANENLFVAANPNNNTNIDEILATGGYTNVVSLATGLDGPVGVAVDGVGNVYIADVHNNAIKELAIANDYATTTTVWTQANSYNEGVAVDGRGNLYITAEGIGELVRLDRADPPSLSFAATAVGSTSVDSPQPVSIYNDGNEPLVFTAPASGVNPEITQGFTIGSNSTCPLSVTPSLPFSLTVGASCSYDVSYSPVVPGPDSGELTLIDDNLNVANAQQIVPLNGGGSSGTTAVPTVTNVSPNNGPVAGNTTVTITGTNFGGATAVAFGGNPASSFAVNSSTSITAVSPAGMGTVDATVTTSGGTSALSAADQFTYTVSSQTIAFSPPAGPAYVGTSVLLAATGGASGNPVVFSVVSGPAMVSGANGSTLTYTGPGTVVVEADQAGGRGDPPAAPVQATLNPVVLTVPVGANSGLITTMVTFQTAGTLFNVRSSTQGLAGGDFYLGSGGTCSQSKTYAAGDTCTLQFGFTPAHPGRRLGGAVFTSASGTVLATSYFYGVGTGPQATFPPGTQSALQGSVSQPAGIALDGAGDVFVATYGSGLVEIPLSGQPRQIGSFSSCQDVFVDGVGNVFVLNDKTTLSEVLAVDGAIPASPTVVTISTAFNGATSLKVDGLGDVFVSNVGSPGSISEVVAVGGSIPASPTILTISSAFPGPTGVAVDSSGNVFVSDDVQNGAYELLAVNGSIPASPTIRTLATGLNLPSNITLDAAGDVFLSDYGDSDVKEIVAVDGSIPANPTVLSLGTGLVQPQGLYVDQSGNIFVADFGLTTAVKLDFSDPPTLTFAPTVVGQTSSDSPQTVTLGNDGNAPLDFSAPLSGFNPSITQGFTVGGASTCPRLSAGATAGQLAPSSTCTDLVSFTPATTGNIAGELVTTDDSLNVAGATQSVPLNGVGLSLILPTITFSVPNQTLGTPPFTVAAVSNSPGAIAYSVVSGPATISGSTVTLTGAGTVELLASQAASGQYAAGTATATFLVAKEPQTIDFAALASPIPLSPAPIKLVATASSGLPVSFSVVSGPGTVNGATLTVTAQGTVVVAANQAGNAQYAAAPTVTRTVVVDPQPKVALAATPNPVFLHNPVTLTSTLSVTGPAPSGTVTFLDGNQPIGTATLSADTATISVSTLSLGTHSITASYGGNANYASAVSAPAAVVVEDFALTVASPDVTIFHGGTATFLFNLTPANSAGLASTVNLAVDGYPEGSKVAIAPASIPAGGGATAVTVVIQTPNYPSGSAQVVPLQRGPSRGPVGGASGGLASAALLLAAWLLLPRRTGRRVRGGLLVLLAFAGLAGLGGCGWGWETQQWTIEMTASSGQLSHTVTAILTSECKDGQPACQIVNQ